MNMKTVVKLCGIAVCGVMLLPTSAAAQTYATSYYYDSNRSAQYELINYLTRLIAQLQAQLDAQNGRYNRGMSTYDIEVDTVDVDSITDDSASLYGEIDLGRSSRARVWFEYGTTRAMNSKTLSGTARSGSHYTFRADVEGLEEDEQYYFRAVAEDPRGDLAFGSTLSFETDDDNDDDDNDEDEPDVTTEEADDVDNESAELNGEVDMNDFEDGTVFFVYGTDEDLVEEIEDEYDTFDDIDEDGDNLRKEVVDSNADGYDFYSEDVFGLEEDEEYFFQICVEYEDEDDDETLLCGGVEEFETDSE